MTKHKNEVIFSLIFFFFSSFFFITITSSLFIANFEDLLSIILRQDGLFIKLLRVLLFIGICISIYFMQANKSKYGKKYILTSLFGIFIFSSLLLISIFSSTNDEDIDGMLNLYYVDNNIVINSAKELVIDSFVFVYFITIPMLGFFYNRKLFNNYFYKTYIQERLPSLNISIIFLFGYSIRAYDFNHISSIIDFILSSFSILVFVKIAFSLRNTITIHSIINLFILVIGFFIVVMCWRFLQACNLYYASLFFYAIGLLYWFFNILAESMQV